MQKTGYTRTRIAPTPSGFLHLGNVFSFALTASLARKTGASILLRIDDLDHQRVQQQYIQDIFDTLMFLDIPWHEGPTRMGVREWALINANEREWSQMKRLDLYQKALSELREGGHVFACNCSRTKERGDCRCRDKSLSLDEPGNAWRLYTPASAALPGSMHEFIVKKKDGFPSYQLACVVDDQHFGVDLIVRGNDLLDSSKAQVFLAGCLGYASFVNSTLLHHPLLLGPGNQKLSKSAGDTSIQYLRQQGKSPQHIFALIGNLAGCTEPLRHWENLADMVVPEKLKPH